MTVEEINELIRMDNLIKFYREKTWVRVRKEVIKKANYECEHCRRDGKLTTMNTINRNGKRTKMEVNHKKPLKQHPELAYELDNLEYLCIDCHNIADNKTRYLKQKKNKFYSPERW